MENPLYISPFTVGDGRPPMLPLLLWQRLLLMLLLLLLAWLLLLLLLLAWLLMSKLELLLFFILRPVLRIHDILACLWIMDPEPDSDPDPAIFIIYLQEANKKLIF
jgi:hypothetical protein